MRLTSPTARKSWLLLLLLLPFQMACGKIKEPVFEAIDSMKITGVRDSGIITADVKVRIRNENSLTYSGNEVEMKIYHKKVMVASGKAADSFQIPSNDTVSFLMHVEFFLDSLMDDSYEILYQDSIPLQIEVNGKFGALRIASKAVMNHQLKTGEMLDILMKENLGRKQIKMEKTSIKDFSPQISTIVSQIRFTNTMPLDLNIRFVDIDIFSDNKLSNKISHWNDSTGFIIPQGKDTLMAPEFKINTMNSAMTGIFKTMTGDNIYYAVGHTVVMFRSRQFKVPLRFKFRFDPLRNQTEVVE